MNRNDYMAAPRRALSILPEEERASALRYYEEYFDDAGPENEGRVIADLGDPQTVAAQILADYRELTAVPPQQDAPPQDAPPRRRWRGIPPWLLIVLVLLAIPIGLPLAGGLLLAVLGVIGAVLAAILAIAAAFILVPLCLLFAGLVLCGFSFVLWGIPANAFVTLGCGLALFAAGILLGLLVIKLCTLFVPPVFRAAVALIRWPFNKIRGRKTDSNGGGNT